MPPINTRIATRPVVQANRPESAPAQAKGGPSLPSASPYQSTTLRSPLPNIVPPSPDNLRQYYVGGNLPQYRFTPPPSLDSNSATPISVTTPAPLTAVLTTTANTTDTISIVGVMSTSTVSLTATNSVAAAMAGVYVSAKFKNSITVTHPATAGGTFDVIVT